MSEIALSIQNFGYIIMFLWVLFMYHLAEESLIDDCYELNKDSYSPEAAKRAKKALKAKENAFKLYRAFLFGIVIILVLRGIFNMGIL